MVASAVRFERAAHTCLDGRSIDIGNTQKFKGHNEMIHSKRDMRSRAVQCYCFYESSYLIIPDYDVATEIRQLWVPASITAA